MRYPLRVAGLGLMAGVLALLTTGCGFAFSPEELPDEEDLIALEESEEEGEDEEGTEGDEKAEEDEEDEVLDGNEEEKEEENGRGSSLKQSQSPDSEKKSSFWPAVLIGGLCILAIIVLFWFLT